ncbi:hypothetical protein U1Q18_005171 [Sarracenia purpurea var. burkii]
MPVPTLLLILIDMGIVGESVFACVLISIPIPTLSSSRLRFSPQGSDRLATGSRRRPDLAKTDDGYPSGIGVKNTLLILGGINCLGVLFTFLVPESTGKSLEEMSQENEEDEGMTESTLRSKKLQKFFTKERQKMKKCLEIFLVMSGKRGRRRNGGVDASPFSLFHWRSVFIADLIFSFRFGLFRFFHFIGDLIGDLF